ncbi:MAG: EAL domain-containing protein [Nevskiaceae bacterium]|nr:MAG: EAL domain-containing protein [Nevskiaceae bacterium]
MDLTHAAPERHGSYTDSSSPGIAVATLLSRNVRAGEQIFAEGDAADCAYVVETGEVEIHARIDDRVECIAVVGPGDLLGEMAVVDDAPRSATAIAAVDTRLTPIDRSQLSSRLQTADPIVRLLLDVVLNRLRNRLGKNGSARSGGANADAIDRIRLENELKSGIHAGELRLYLQPIADMRSQRIAGFESLVRWQHPICGIVRPDLFIRVAEDSGLIVPLGRWVLREACRAALRFEHETNRANLRGQGGFISVNVSPGQFRDPEFLPALADILHETGLQPSRLKLEITESVFGDAEAAKRWIAACRKLGVRIALDDFGTGYSSLSYLHEFDIDTLKIDQSFVRRILSDARSEKIVAAIVQLSQSLGLEIIAEGVETEALLQRLAAMGCQYAQGYLIARPSPVEAYFAAA